jgi:hypothetical protein
MILYSQEHIMQLKLSETFRTVSDVIVITGKSVFQDITPRIPLKVNGKSPTSSYSRASRARIHLEADREQNLLSCDCMRVTFG